MTEWGVFGVVAALITFGVCVGTPLLKLNANLTRLNVVLELFQKQFDDEKKDNEKEHTALWSKCDEHDGALADHDKRLTLMERTKEN
jgi:hypothetical protein